MKLRLQELAALSTGLYLKPSPGGDTISLQGKDFDEDGLLREEAILVPEVQIEERQSHHLLQPGDILLMAKGAHNRACLYPPHIGKAVAASVFILIRPDQGAVLPEYLCWYLNAPRAQALLAVQARGTQTLSLTQKVAGQLEIPLPPRADQARIAAAHCLLQREKALRAEILAQQTRLRQMQLLQFVHATSKTKP